MFLLTKDGRQGSTVRDESKYFDQPLDMESNDDGVYIDLLDSLNYRVSPSGKVEQRQAFRVPVAAVVFWLYDKKHPVIRIVSTTTRAIRPGEVEGEDYYYISVEEHMRLRNEV